MRSTGWSFMLMMKVTVTVTMATMFTFSSAAADSFVPRALAPEHGVEVLNRAAARHLVGRELLAEPASSALFGEVHLYDEFPYIDARYVHVTSDARWQRLLFGAPGEAPRAFGAAGEGAGEFIEPRGLAFAPDGRLFVADRALGRVSVLRLQQTADGPSLQYVTHIDGMLQPIDVAVYDGGTPADASDDRLLVAEAGAHCVSLFTLEGAEPVRLLEFGSCGPARGEFLYPRALTVGRRDGANTTDVFVADSGNHRVVRLRLDGTRLSWQGEALLPMEATSIDSDHHGNLFISMRRQNAVWKLSPSLEKVAEVTTATLSAPRDVAIPFAWVHDHRRGRETRSWRGEGSALVLEAWQDDTGVRLLELGVEVAALRRADTTALELTLTDAAETTAEITDAQGRVSFHALGVLAAGTQVVEISELAGASKVKLSASSLYDDARRDEAALEFAAPGARVTLEQNVPNPFNPRTRISFELSETTRAVVEVFDVRGRRVRRVLDSHLAAGRHDVVWDGADTSGRRLSSGIYFYRLQAGDETQVRKMVMAQ